MIWRTGEREKFSYVLNYYYLIIKLKLLVRQVRQYVFSFDEYTIDGDDGGSGSGVYIVRDMIVSSPDIGRICTIRFISNCSLFHSLSILNVVWMDVQFCIAKVYCKMYCKRWVCRAPTPCWAWEFDFIMNFDLQLIQQSLNDMPHC